MDCPACQTPNRDARRFCKACGTALVPLPCPACAFENWPGEDWCGGCGIRLDQASATVATAEAERRQLTVMFVDLAGSTALSEALDPEDLRDHMLAFQRTCAGVIEGCGGFVARYMGDGILAYFGYPQALEDAAERAVRAGLAVVDAMPGLAQGAFHPRVRVGIATGPVVVGDEIGDGASRERAVVGETPNLAARLQSAAALDTVLVSDRTRRLVGGSVAFEDGGRHALKGFEESVQAWRPVALRRVRTTHGRRPLVGRTRELSFLADQLGTAAEGTGQVVELVGEAESGKSHLLQAFLDGSGVDVLVHACSRHLEAGVLAPSRERIGEAAGIELVDDAGVRREKLAGWVRSWSADPARDLPAVQALFSVQEEAVDPEQVRDRILELLDRELTARLDQGPVVLAFDDVQWADPTTLAHLERQIERARWAPLLCVLTRRPTFHTPWATRSDLGSVVVGRLADDEARALVRGLLPEEVPAPEVVDRILERSDGVPGYLVELSRAVAASGDGPDAAIPETLRDSLAAQLDRLGEARDLAQTAAAIGREFPLALLERVATGGQLHRRLDALVRHEVVVPLGAEGSRYAFRHALLRDLAYDRLLKRSRRALHDRIATVLTEELADAGRADPAGVAWHLTEAGRRRQANHWYLTAADNAAAQAARQESIALRRRALSVLEGAIDPTDPADCAQMAQQLVALAAQLRVGFSHDEAFPLLDRAEGLVRPHDLAEELSRIHHMRGEVYSRLDMDRCVEQYNLALAEAVRSGSPVAEIRARGGLADVCMSTADMAGAIALATPCLALAEAHGLTDVAANVASTLLVARYYTLDLEGAWRAADDALRFAREGKLVRRWEGALMMRALVALERDDLAEAEACLLESDRVVGRGERSMAAAEHLVRARLHRASNGRTPAPGAMPPLVPHDPARLLGLGHRIAVGEDEASEAELDRLLAELDQATPFPRALCIPSLVEELVCKERRRGLARALDRLEALDLPPLSALWLRAGRAAVAAQGLDAVLADARKAGVGTLLRVFDRI